MDDVIRDNSSEYNGRTLMAVVLDLEQRVKALEAIVDRLEGVDL